MTWVNLTLIALNFHIILAHIAGAAGKRVRNGVINTIIGLVSFLSEKFLLFDSKPGVRSPLTFRVRISKTEILKFYFLVRI